MKKILFGTSILMIAAMGANAQTAKKKVAATKAFAKTPLVLKTETDTFSYALGMNIAHNLKQQGITEINEAYMEKGLRDLLHDDSTALTDEQASKSIQQKLKDVMGKKLSDEKAKGAAYLAANGKRAGVITLPDGMQYEVLKKSDSGKVSPAANDTVVANYVGTLIDGKEFDNSYKRGQPLTIPVGGVIKGWTEILQLMHVGDKYKVYIPSELGYGDRGAGGSIPGGATLIFEMELLGIKQENNMSEDLRYPIGKIADQKFTGKGIYSDKFKTAAIRDIELLPQLLEFAVLNLDEKQLNTPYRPDGWTVKQVVHHVADSHMNAYIRFKLGLTEENVVIKPYDEVAWANLSDTKNVPINVSLTLLHALHIRLVALLKSIEDEEWQRTVFHPEHKSLITLWNLLALYAWHGKHHTAHITELRKRNGWH